MPKQNNKQISFGFEFPEGEAQNLIDTTSKEKEASVDFSFIERLSKREYADDCKIYDGILALVKDRYP
jgi:Ca2+-binding EF-hand superfamily protein